MVRSAGGWAALISLRKSNLRMASDERILGDGYFVESVLKAASERMENRYQMEASGFDLEQVVKRVSSILGIPSEMAMEKSRRPLVVKARDLICYWSNHELGISMTTLANKFALSQPAVSYAVRRGEKIVKNNNYSLLEK